MSRPLLKSSQDAVARAAISRLFVLELNAGRIHTMNTDGSGRKTIVSDCHMPDGSVSIQAALCDAKFFGLHDRMHPANAAMNVYRAKDDTWFVLLITPDKVAAVAKVIGRPDILTDPRFSDPAKLMANMPQLAGILEGGFRAEPMEHWYKVFSGVHVTFGAVRGPQEVINDPRLRANDIIVPLEGARGKLTSTISSPLQVHGVAKLPAKRAPNRRTQRRGSQAARGNWHKPCGERSVGRQSRPRRA
jgi:crotonobetainyl-CoA:carnitine CoA-transferase CaiB-like acyl-CoA transferase